VKLFKELKKQGLNSQNIGWYADALTVGAMKLPDVSEEYENLKSDNENTRR
jgi:murein endopeptidase